MTLDELPGYLMMLAARAGEAAIPASDAMSGHFTKVVKERLTAKSHARGTVTPAPAGGPPAMESGELAGSVQQVPASTPVVATSSSAPHVEPRDWVQEYGIGGGISAKRFPYMKFTYNGVQRKAWVPAHERSYMRSTLEILIGDGSLTREAAAAFYAAMWG